MIKRMVIMLVAVAIVFGGIFGFQVFKGIMIKKFIGALSNPPQTDLRRQSQLQRMAAEDRGGWQLARREGRRSVAGSFRRRRIDHV